MKSFLSLKELPIFRTVEKEIVICPRCKGEGIIQERNCIGHADNWTMEDLPCPDCRTKGRMFCTLTTRLSPLE